MTKAQTNETKPSVLLVVLVPIPAQDPNFFS